MNQSVSSDLDMAKWGNRAAFTRSFLKWMEENKVESAVAHKWKNGFNYTLGDVDIIVSYTAFAQIVRLVHGFCSLVGWRMCQVIRHESTAAFFVCSWTNDPSVAVAFDVCSDYRRRERVLINAEDLLQGREPLPCGGSRLSFTNELRYRFIKGAIKSKDPRGIISSLGDYPESALQICSQWISSQWGVTIKEWTKENISSAWIKLDKLTLKEPKKGLRHVLRRIIHRLTKPTGLILVCGDQANIVTESHRIFHNLYFRSSHELPYWSAPKLRGLVYSSLYSVPKLGGMWKILIGKNLWIEVNEGESAQDFNQRIATHLAYRCQTREGIRADGYDS